MAAPNEILASLSLRMFYALPENKSDCKHCDFDAELPVKVPLVAEVQKKKQK